MSTSNGSPVESTRIECGGCDQSLAFGFQLNLEGPSTVGNPGQSWNAPDLYHADGTEVCSVPEPKWDPYSVIWPQLEGVPYVPGRVGAVTPSLRTYVDPPEERDRPPVIGVLLLILALAGLLSLWGLCMYAWFPWEILP